MASFSSRRLMAALSVFALLALSSFPSLVSSQTNSSAPQVLFHGPNTALTLRWYASCAINVHQIGQWSATPTLMQFGGSTTGYVVQGTYDLTTNGGWDNAFTLAATPALLYTPTGYSGCNPIGRVAAGGVFLANGNLVVMGGKACPGWSLTNDVIYSTNNAASFDQAVAAAPGPPLRLLLRCRPTTNTIVLAGGTDAIGITNDVWTSTDGKGAVWTLVTAAPGFPKYQEGPMTFLFDATTNGRHGHPRAVQPVRQLLLLLRQLRLYLDSDANLTTTGVNPNQDARMVAGADNSLFMAGGGGLGTNQVLYSSNKGATWSYLNNQNWSPNVTTPSPWTISPTAVWPSAMCPPALRPTATTTSW